MSRIFKNESLMLPAKTAIGLLWLLVFFFTPCSRKPALVQFPDTQPQADYIISAQPAPPPDTIHYHSIMVKKDSIKYIKKYYNDSQLQIILAVNRIDFLRLYRMDSLVVPDTFIYDFLAYSPFPHQVSMLDSIKKYCCSLTLSKHSLRMKMGTW